MPTHLDLFSGIGGFALAAQWTGWTTIGFSEIDPYACKVLEKQFPGIPNYGDVRTIPAVQCDLITGGFPCQPFSCAGKRRGEADDRYLWPAMLDVIGRCKPTWVLGENVPGIIGMELDRVLADLEGVGFRSAPIIIPACASGADHKRKRVWIIAHANRERKLQSQRTITKERGWIVDCDPQITSYIDGQRLQASRQCAAPERTQERNALEPAASGFPGRETYPDLLREVHGIPRRVDRIKCLGNAIVPQVAAVILDAMMKVNLTLGQPAPPGV